MPTHEEIQLSRPLDGSEHAEALSKEKPSDGNSLQNPQSKFLPTIFPEPITNSRRGGFDIHIYFLHTNPAEVKFARALHEKIRREFPGLRVYAMVERPIGPHPVGMFEVSIMTPTEYGIIVPWLVVHRGPLSVLIHPNTPREKWDHTVGAMWLGQPFPLQTWMLHDEEEQVGKSKL